VDDLCSSCRTKTIFGDYTRDPPPSPHDAAASHLLSLARVEGVTRIIIVTSMTTMPRSSPARVIRVTEEINGRSYAIEVLPVEPERWRARLAQRGTTNAVMPFYGATPGEAIGQLTNWIARVSRPARPQA
jgi:hypothetical protein